PTTTFSPFVLAKSYLPTNVGVAMSSSRIGDVAEIEYFKVRYSPGKSLSLSIVRIILSLLTDITTK
ncbi:MAG TPA: hypothetical protein PKG85_09880, partial [Mesotoga infera]|nr:hypothetical protein [Mesotoga infera]